MKLRMFLRVVYSVRTVLAFASTLFLVISIKAEAQAQTDDDRAIAGAMDATNEFMQTFNNKNSVAWEANLNYPHVGFAGTTVTAWDSAKELSDTKHLKA